MAGSLRPLVVMALLVGLAACSSGIDEGKHGTGGGAGSGTGQPETTTPTGWAATGGEATAPSEAPANLDYVALGDSLAAGVRAGQGYVERYADHLRSDTGAEVRVVNLGVSGQTGPQLLGALRNDPEIRESLREAEVVTFNIGINDLGRAGRSYASGTCGGPDNEGCLRAAVGALERNWDAITGEILGLRSTDDAVVRTAGLGYTPNIDDGVFGPYLDEANRHIAAAADENGIPHVEVRLGTQGMSPDGVHPNDEGYAKIADGLRSLGYEPLGFR